MTLEGRERLLCEEALSRAKKLGATYADARIVRLKTQSLSVKNGNVDDCSHGSEQGIGVRVIVDGSWGFAGNPDIRTEKIEICVERAVAMARAAASLPHEKIQLAANPVYPHGLYQTPMKKDPFQVPLKEQIDYLLACDQQMGTIPEVKIRQGSMDLWNEWKIFMNSDGSCIQQDITHFGAGITATTLGDEVFTRSYPSSFRGQHSQGGYELLEDYALLPNAKKIALEARDLLTAPQCPSGRMTVVLGGSQLALQVHESCGHPVELDRVFGMEANYAGTSFLTTEKMGKFRYGSDIVNIVCDATSPLGLGTFGYDDDGVKAQCGDIVKEGQFVGYLMGRDTATMLGLSASNGAIRTEGWNNFPMIRMTNINLLPGNTPYEDLIRGVEYGLLLTDNSSWSICDKRLNFQFGCEVGWIIKKGKIDHMVKNPTYTGITPEFWANCKAIADKNSWRMWGTPNCGKGQPPQTMRVGHGVSFARFDNVQVGVAYDH